MKPVNWLLAIVPELLLLLALGCSRPDPDTKVEKASKPPHHGSKEDIFARGKVLRIDIEIPRSGISALRRTQWGEGGGERPSTKATVREDGVVYSSVAVHLKGAAGSFRPVDDQPAMTLNFDKFIPGQSFHGLHKISLNNSVQDPSYLSEKICRELFDAAGVPVPRAGHALVKLNGRDLGFYVLLEGANKQFLKRYFSNPTGNLYDGGFVHELDGALAVNCGDNPKDRSGLTALTSAMEATRRSRNLAPLEKALDVDRFLSMMAMEVMVSHWDGYALNRNNWRIFHDLDAKRMVFIPHGLDQTFGIGQQRDVSVINRIHWEGEVAADVMQTAEGRRRFSERVSQLYSNVFRVDQILGRIDEIQAGISPALAQWDAGAARNQEQQAAWFKRRIAQRGEELRRQLGTVTHPVKLGSGGAMRLIDWQPSTVRLGAPKLTQTTDPEGNVLLGITVEKGLSSGSWRTRLSLPEGQYRLEGRLRLQDVAVESDDTRGGAGLRISKGPMPPKQTGTTDWSNYVYEFRVDEKVADTELICELRATQGEAWFDRSSLKLTRLR